MNKIINNKSILFKKSPNKQQGAILIWSVVIVIILTMVGISAVKMSTISTKMTGNSLFSMLVFQGAESALGKTAKIHYMKLAIEKLPGKNVDVALSDENVSNGKLKSSVNVAWSGYQECPINSFAYSSKQKCHYFNINAVTSLGGTGARTTHTLGVAKPGPSTGVTWTP